MACDLDGSKIGSEAHQRINESRDRRISASAHQLIGAQVWLGAHVTDGVLPLQASVVEHSDQSRKTVTQTKFCRRQSRSCDVQSKCNHLLYSPESVPDLIL